MSLIASLTRQIRGSSAGVAKDGINGVSIRWSEP